MIAHEFLLVNSVCRCVICCSLYGGELAAAKAACNELRAINSIIDCNLPAVSLASAPF